MSDEERDFLAEARQSRELAAAMAEMSSLTAAATASLNRTFDHTTTPILSTDDTYSSSNSMKVESTDTSDKDFEYPDMSRYYSGKDYASSLPNISDPSPNNPSSYSSGFSLFNSGKESPRDNDMNDSSKLLRPRDYGAKSTSNGGGSIMKKIYVCLVIIFISLLLLDVSQQQMPKIGNDMSSKSVLITGGTRDRNTNVSFHGAKLNKLKINQKDQKDEPLQRVMVLGRHGASPGKFDQPKGLAMVRKRFLFVSDFGNKRVQMFLFHGAPEVDEQSGELAHEVLEYALEMDQIGGVRIFTHTHITPTLFIYIYSLFYSPISLSLSLFIYFFATYYTAISNVYHR